MKIAVLFSITQITLPIDPATSILRYPFVSAPLLIAFTPPAPTIYAVPFPVRELPRNTLRVRPLRHFHWEA